MQITFRRVVFCPTGHIPIPEYSVEKYQVPVSTVMPPLCKGG